MPLLDRRTLIGTGLAAATPGLALAQSNLDWVGIKRLMQGPVLGWCATESAAVWTRSSGAWPVCVEFDLDPLFPDPRRTTVQLADAAEDFVQVHRLEGLKPDRTYAYRVLVDGKINPDDQGLEPYRLTTPAGAPARFRLAFGSCARRARYPVQPIWRAVETARPDLFIWAGDAVYADSLDPHILAEEYRRQRDLPEIRRFMAETPQFCIWDDHDYGLNDQDRRHPGKVAALETFRRYWPNPAAGLPEAPGAFFQWSQGGVDFFFLDVRYYRDPNQDPNIAGKTMLGAVQRDWLLSGLKASQAPFKVLVSGSGWNDGKVEGADSWASFTHERDAIFDAVMAADVAGVVLLSGDTHFGEMNCLPWSERGGYDLYEFVSSPLAQDTVDLYLTGRPVMRVRQAFSADVNFGVVDFDMTLPDPTVRFELRDEGGQAAWPAVVVKASELHPGVKSWPGKLDAISSRRWAAAGRGQDYFGSARP
jgi:alkaline phosphatase D